MNEWVPIGSVPTPPPDGTNTYDEWISLGPCDSVTKAAVSFYEELVLVIGPNTLTPLTFPPQGGLMLLIVNGTAFAPPDGSFSVSGTTVTWLSTVYGLKQGDTVVAVYTYLTPPDGVSPIGPQGPAGPSGDNASALSLYYVATQGQTHFSFAVLDRFGNANATPNPTGVQVARNGALLAPDDGSGFGGFIPDLSGLGAIDLLWPAGAGEVVAINLFVADPNILPDAPWDGTIYARQNATWVPAPSGGGGGTPSSALPLMDGPPAAGAALPYSREDHVHPTDTSRYAASNPAGYVTLAQAASAAPVQSVASRTGAVTLTHSDITDWTASISQPATVAPVMDGTASVGTSVLYARQDHVHPVDTSRYAATNPSGFQTAAQVTASLAPYALTTSVPVASSTTPLMNGAAAIGSGATWAKADHVHPTDTTLLPKSGGVLTGALTPSSTAGVVGTSTNDNANAGAVGEVISSNVTSPVTMTTATGTNIASISLTAGDWDVSGEVWFVIGTGGANQIQGAISAISATNPSASAVGTSRTNLAVALTASTTQNIGVRTCRVSLAATTTYYLVAVVGFPSGACTAAGNIWARRAR